MKKPFLIAAVAVALGGTALHFLFDLWPNALTALVSPVNESVWEHLKLLFWPMLAAALVLSFRTRRPYDLWSAFFAALLAMPLFLLGVYYLIRCGFGYTALWLDITLYYVSVAFGFLLTWRLYQSGTLARRTGVLLMLVMFYAAALVLFTFAAPPLGIFESA